uniref:Uncharacterized protein n=1 Tax=Arundo donax TaxID=35708 RepID=A0A0A9H899_ARUDO
MAELNQLEVQGDNWIKNQVSANTCFPKIVIAAILVLALFQCHRSEAGSGHENPMFGGRVTHNIASFAIFIRPRVCPKRRSPLHESKRVIFSILGCFVRKENEGSTRGTDLPNRFMKCPQTSRDKLLPLLPPSSASLLPPSSQKNSSLLPPSSPSSLPK